MTLIQYLITDTEWTKNLHVIAYSPEILRLIGFITLMAGSSAANPQTIGAFKELAKQYY